MAPIRVPGVPYKGYHSGPQTIARWPRLSNSVLERSVPLRNM
jgi:hypothetical protein